MRRALLVIAALLLLSACGIESSAETMAIFRSELNGDNKIKLTATPALLAWAEQGGKPTAGARRRMLERSLPKVEALWNPEAIDPAQEVIVDIDDNTVLLDENGNGPCVAKGYSAWTVPGTTTIYVCPRWIFCIDESQTQLWTHYGQAGCDKMLEHELGHCLGAKFHVDQNGRPLHNSGPIMASWSSDAINPKLPRWTKEEDVPKICLPDLGGGGWNGECGAQPITVMRRPLMPFMLKHVVGD